MKNWWKIDENWKKCKSFYWIAWKFDKKWKKCGIPIKQYGKLMKNEKNEKFPLNNIGNWQKSEEMGGRGRTYVRTNERKSPCVLQDIVPFRAAAQKASKCLFSTLRPVLTDQRTNRPTDVRTDGRTDKASYRVACPQLKSEQNVLPSSLLVVRRPNEIHLIMILVLFSGI